VIVYCSDNNKQTEKTKRAKEIEIEIEIIVANLDSIYTIHHYV